jgi:hypothetical protein
VQLLEKREKDEALARHREELRNRFPMTTPPPRKPHRRRQFG